MRVIQRLHECSRDFASGRIFHSKTWIDLKHSDLELRTRWTKVSGGNVSESQMFDTLFLSSLFFSRMVQQVLILLRILSALLSPEYGVSVPQGRLCRHRQVDAALLTLRFGPPQTAIEAV